jgi:adenylate cyclase
MSTGAQALAPPAAIAPTACAVLFADVAGSTRLYETLGDAAALKLVSELLATLREAAAASGGRVVKNLGDEILCVFPDSAAAVRAACDMQLAAIGRCAVRVGMHWGDVLASGDDVFGDTVNTAARVTALARARQILTTETTAALLPPAFRAALRPLHSVAVRGKRAEILLQEVLWETGADSTMVDAARMPAASLEFSIEHGGRIYTLPNGTLTLGRDGGCDIVVSGAKASRVHARIERRRDKTVLVDSSTNGTWVRQSDGRQVLLRREELMLHGDGTIGCGDPPDSGNDGLIRFRSD